jgi:hypothetical protein
LPCMHGRRWSGRSHGQWNSGSSSVSPPAGQAASRQAMPGASEFSTAGLPGLQRIRAPDPSTHNPTAEVHRGAAASTIAWSASTDSRSPASTRRQRHRPGSNAQARCFPRRPSTIVWSTIVWRQKCHPQRAPTAASGPAAYQEKLLAVFRSYGIPGQRQNALLEQHRCFNVSSTEHCSSRCPLPSRGLACGAAAVAGQPCGCTGRGACAHCGCFGHDGKGCALA